VGGTLVRHASFHATPFGRVLRADQNERLCGLLRSAGRDPLLVGADWNTQCADRDAEGELYEPGDPFAEVEWFDELVHQCAWTYDPSGRRVPRVDLTPGDVLWSGGLHDAAALLKDPFGIRGVHRRIDAIRVTADVGVALRAHQVLDTDAGRVASDHLPAAVDYAPSGLLR